jgi:transcription initiation factor TFIIIB Brf1 subunit/transcription initiation factor TFIIB
MPRCPNCSYILVLLERRGKYKCAKCGKLYPQKQIDDKEFRGYNKRQREKDKEDYEQQLRLRLKYKPHRHKVSSKEKQKKLTDFKAVHYALHKGYYRKINAQQYQKFKEKILAKAQERYEKNREAILKRNKMWQSNNKERSRETHKKYRQANRDKIGLINRIAYWRQRQKKLAIEYFKDVLIFSDEV